MCVRVFGVMCPRVRRLSYTVPEYLVVRIFIETWTKLTCTLSWINGLNVEHFVLGQM